MDSATRAALNINEALQHRRSADLLVREAAREIELANVKAAGTRAQMTMRAALAARYENNWNLAPGIRDRNERIASEWNIQTKTSNSILLDEPLQTRTLTAASAAGGGYLVETANQLRVQEAHSTAGAILNLMSVYTAQNATGNQFVGKLQTLPTVSVLSSETATITEQTPNTQQAALTPKHLASWGRASKQWVLQSDAGAAAVSRLHVNAVRSKILQQILEGTGASGQLLGLVANSDVAHAAGTSVDMAAICTAMESVEKTGSGPFAWVVSAAAAKLLRQRAVISGGDAILADGMIAGYPCYVTGCTTSAIACFGSWGDMQVYQWRPLEVAVDPYSDFQSGQVGLRCWATVDALPMLVGSFYALTAIT